LPPDIDEAIETGHRAVAIMPAAFPQRAAVLSNLAGAHQARFEHTGDLADLDEAIDQGRRAATDTASPHRTSVLANLCGALQLRSEYTGDSADLDEAISAGLAAVEATPAGDPSLPATLTNVGTALVTRFDRTG